MDQVPNGLGALSGIVQLVLYAMYKNATPVKSVVIQQELDAVGADVKDPDMKPSKQVTHLKDCIHNSSPFVVDIHDTDLNHEDLHGKWSKGTKNYSPGAGTPTWGYKFADLFRTHNSL